MSQRYEKLADLINFVATLSLEEKEKIRAYLDSGMPESQDAALDALVSKLSDMGVVSAGDGVQSALERLAEAAQIAKLYSANS